MQSKPGVLADLLASADAMIEAESGLADPGDAGADANVVLYGAWIVRYLMQEHLSSTNEVDARRHADNFRLATDKLRAMRGVRAGNAAAPRAEWINAQSPGYVENSRTGVLP